MRDASSETFALARMSPLIRGLTALVLAIAPLFVALGLLTRASILATIGLALTLLYGAVWVFWRPTSFEVSPAGLRIRFPGRRRAIAAREIAAVRLLSPEGFREEYGLALRIGVGGLWGGFGWLWTSKRGLLDLYVSRLDGYVVVERRGGARPLLFTPVDPEELVEALSALL